MYSLAEGCLIADAIDHFESHKKKSGELYSPQAVIDDVQSAIRSVHISGMMHSAVMNDLDRFIIPNPKLPDIFTHLAKGGKRFLLCTNSGFKYTNKALSHVLKLPFKPSGMEWRDIFDIVICSASKPNFYFNKSQFRIWNVDAGTASTSPVLTLKKGDVYVNGSVHALIDATGWNGKDVLYLVS
jgi:HAD superfamily 5'-nucleotidase-like hydrolase